MLDINFQEFIGSNEDHDLYQIIKDSNLEIPAWV